jgi:imidazolonepropionase-like amidohydrolase
MEGEIGTIEPGKRADLIATQGSPLEDISALLDVRFVMKDGEVYKDDGLPVLPVPALPVPAPRG